jgi:thiamine transporter ThiT
LSIVWSVLLFCPLYGLSCCFVHCMVCLVVLFILSMDKTTRQTIQWRKQQDRQYNGQNNKTDNTMDKTTRQTIQWTKQQNRPLWSVLLFCPLYGLFCCFVHCMVCLVVLSIVWSVLLFCPLYGLSCCFVHCMV